MGEPLDLIGRGTSPHNIRGRSGKTVARHGFGLHSFSHRPVGGPPVHVSGAAPQVGHLLADPKGCAKRRRADVGCRRRPEVRCYQGV